MPAVTHYTVNKATHLDCLGRVFWAAEGLAFFWFWNQGKATENNQGIPGTGMEVLQNLQKFRIRVWKLSLIHI